MTVSHLKSLLVTVVIEKKKPGERFKSEVVTIAKKPGDDGFLVLVGKK